MTATPQVIFSGIPEGLRRPLLDEYNKLAKHYREGHWEPAELNGGKLCEIVYSILRGHVDSAFANAPYKPDNMVVACRKLEEATGFPRSVRIQVPRMLLALYEIRNNRNVGHIGADVDPSHMDASLVLAMVRWMMAELVRIFHGTTTEEATQMVESLTERSLPILWHVGDVTRVLAPLSAKDKTLAVLYSAPGPLDVKSLLASVEYGNASRYRSSILKDAHREHLLHFDAKADTAQISPVGSRYVEERVALETSGYIQFQGERSTPRPR
ncbi:hypothetical protein [Mesorhizobium sp. B2-8-5]|uniref:hypothetical protein n=1 Tax=Mesorhizobium sp. B2-8-5 TaxID=2589903 RepID=UPI00112736B3|nr:hypothetical protein [Mesorhizobium sp. B2-8-5]UCI26534.1 hypothetical protein FJ430_02710 [Mesorhizobium sp. B2-8-5]